MEFYSICCLAEPEGPKVAARRVGGTFDRVLRLSLFALTLITVAVVGV